MDASTRPQSPIPSNMNRRNSPPPSPPSPDPTETEFKLSRKREREVSLEPALPPKPLDIDSHGREARKPAKKNKLQLGTTEEEEDASSQGSSLSDSPPLGVSPPREVTKRLRDDPDHDENPRETKRLSPPPEKTPPKPPASSKKSGFESYASTSSPFAGIKGQSLFGSAKSALSSSFTSSQGPALTTRTTPSTPTISPSPSCHSTQREAFTTIPATAPAKRSAFDVFASSASPLASVGRSKSPVLGSSSKLGRAKSPPRFPNAAPSSAFSSYAHGVQSFAAPVPKRARGESPNGLPNGKKTPSVLPDDPQDSGGSEDGERVPSFGERLRTEKDEDEDVRSDDESAKTTLTKQTVTTGEEDEETLYQVRGKLYALQGNQWKEKGTGALKLNVKRSDGSGARLVMRKEAVFTLLLNVTLFHGMRCSLAQDPRYLRFSVIESGSTVHYNLRVSNARIAQELLDEINDNIAPA